MIITFVMCTQYYNLGEGRACVRVRLFRYSNSTWKEKNIGSAKRYLQNEIQRALVS